jgi:hypothetical protein
VLDDVTALDLEHGEAIVCIERREMLVPARLHKLRNSKPLCEIVGAPLVRLPGDPSELRPQQPAGD